MRLRRLVFGSIGISLGVQLSTLFALFAVSCGILAAYQLSNIEETARSLRLHKQLEELRQDLRLESDGVARVVMPADRLARYQGDDPNLFFAVRNGAGDIALNSSAVLTGKFGAEFLRELTAGEQDRADGGKAGNQFHFLSEPLGGAGGKNGLLIVAYRTSTIDTLLNEVERRLLVETGLSSLVIFFLVFGACLAVVRLSFAPLHRLSRQLTRVGLGDRHHGVDQADLPTELRGLAQAANASARQLEEVITSQRRFTADTAHQLLTPLALLSARIDQMEGAGREADLRGDLKRMESLIRQLLLLSRLASVPLPFGRVDLREIAKEAVINLAPLALAEGKNLSYDGPEVPCIVNGNAGAIYEALGNVIRNGLRHTAPGTCVETIVEQPAAVAIADQGEGLPEGAPERLLEPFVTTQADKGGTGLGLAIVNGVMRRHGGTVQLENRSAGGALFRLRFKAADELQGCGAGVSTARRE